MHSNKVNEEHCWPSVLIQPEAVTLCFHLGQTAFVAFVPDLKSKCSNTLIPGQEVKNLEVDVSAAVAVPIPVFAHHLRLDQSNSVLLKLRLGKQAGLGIGCDFMNYTCAHISVLILKSSIALGPAREVQVVAPEEEKISKELSNVRILLSAIPISRPSLRRTSSATTPTP